ncbi:MAG TPA: DNA primase, partial [Chitinophagaceae bacterium]
MISQNTIQQILGRIDIIDVVGGFVKLKKRGTNYLGLCPFHNERTPSFTVSPSKEIYKCFGCGKSGNTISFLMEHEKYSYVDSLRWLANRYGIEIEESFATDEQRQQMQVADSLYIINNFAQQFFSKILFETEEGRDIGLSYLKERGFREDIIKKFQLGYNPEARDSFTKAAIAAQYNTELLLKTGLVANRNDQFMDNYRGRIIFPVHNHSGKVLGFGARILKTNDKAPKYINTPENEIYVKSKILYGSYFARMAIDKADECLLVEGYTDVISLHQSGIENVVASGGTSLTIDQLRLIRKYTNNLTIIYDGDAAGIKAALRGLDLALEEGLNVKLVLIPDKEDPDSYVNKVGASAFNEFVRSNRKDFILFQLEVALKDAGSDSTKKSEVVNSIAETISKINKAEDFTKQQDYIKQCSEILKIDEGGLHALVNKFIRNKISTQEKALPPDSYRDGEARSHEENAQKGAATDYDDATFNLLFKDELQEKEFARVLLEHGNKKWQEGIVAEFMLEQILDEGLFDNADVLRLIGELKNILETNKTNLDKNLFIYH